MDDFACVFWQYFQFWFEQKCVFYGEFVFERNTKINLVFPILQNQGTIKDIQGANIMTTFFIEDLYAIASVQNNKKEPNQ